MAVDSIKVLSPREKYWRTQMSSCESSGLTIAAYCRRSGVSVGQYYWWKKELKRRAQNHPMAVSPFAEVHRVESLFCGDSPLEVLLAQERRILVRPGFDSETLAQVVRVLEDMSYVGGA